MRVSDGQLGELRSRGWVVVPNFLEPEELREAQEGLWESGLQRPEAFFDPSNAEERAKFRNGPRFFADSFPFRSLALNKLLLHPNLIDACERFLGGSVRLTIGHTMSKYASTGKGTEWDPDYDQRFHRDYGNHTLVVPRADRQYDQVTTFIYLSDVTRANGATALVPRTVTENNSALPLAYNYQGGPKGSPTAMPEEEYAKLQAAEERAEGPAGSLLLYTYDVFHRGTAFDTPGASRFASLAGYRRHDAPWVGKHINWGAHALNPEVVKLVTDLSPRQRECLEFPAVGHPYWNEQTIEDVGLRYAGMDMEPYRRGRQKYPQQQSRSQRQRTASEPKL